MTHGGKRAGSGRKPGVQNKLTKDVKEAIAQAFDKVGGTKYLIRQANENPKAFMALLGKLIPTQLTGEGDEPLIPKSNPLEGLDEKKIAALINLGMKSVTQK